jgi:hypothetical protein
MIGSSQAVAAPHTSASVIELCSSEKGVMSHAWPVKYNGVKLAPKQHASDGLGNC